MEFSEFFDSKNPANEVFLVSLNLVFDEYGVTEHIDRLSKEARLVYLLWCFDGEIHNGGFDQLFTNSLGCHIIEILEHLKVVGATNSHNMLKTAISWFPNYQPNSDRSIRYEQYSKFCENETYINQENQLCEEFYHYKDNLEGLLNSFVKLNPSASVNA